MTPAQHGTQAAALCHAALDQPGDPADACFNLIAAAMATCHAIPISVLPALAVEELQTMLSVPGSILIEAGRGPLALIEPAGRA